MARILLIDHERPAAEELARALVARGVEVVVEVDGRAGLERALAERFDLVVTEMLLPLRDGAELIGELRDRAPALPVVARTGGDAEFEVVDLLDLALFQGAAGTFSKSLDLQETADRFARWASGGASSAEVRA